MQADPETAAIPSESDHPHLNVLKDRPLDVVAVKETRTIKRNFRNVFDRICMWAEGVHFSSDHGTMHMTLPRFLFYRRITVASCLLILTTMVCGAT